MLEVSLSPTGRIAPRRQASAVSVYLQPFTYRRSCPDACHYYGVVLDAEGAKLFSIPRSPSWAMLVSIARRDLRKTGRRRYNLIVRDVKHC